MLKSSHKELEISTALIFKPERFVLLMYEALPFRQEKQNLTGEAAEVAESAEFLFFQKICALCVKAFLSCGYSAPWSSKPLFILGERPALFRLVALTPGIGSRKHTGCRCDLCRIAFGDCFQRNLG